jgi:DNA-binding response OmpR family regulator
MKASILVVDDQPAIVLSSQYKLKLQGYDVDTAANGEEALKITISCSWISICRS